MRKMCKSMLPSDWTNPHCSSSAAFPHPSLRLKIVAGGSSIPPAPVGIIGGGFPSWQQPRTKGTSLFEGRGCWAGIPCPAPFLKQDRKGRERGKYLP